IREAFLGAKVSQVKRAEGGPRTFEEIYTEGVEANEVTRRIEAFVFSKCSDGMRADQFASRGPGDASAAPQGRAVKYAKAENTVDYTKINLPLRLGAKGGHGLGPPDAFKLAAACVTMAGTAAPETKEVLTDYLNKYKPGSRGAQHVVGFFRTEKMFDSKKKRLMIAMKDEKLERVLLCAVEAAEKKVAWSGPRPVGHLEVEGQKIIEAMPAQYWVGESPEHPMEME
ncbi:unnamed protein product, partial [Prorocentrum cordatum]